jgi:hypothetical protein
LLLSAHQNDPALGSSVQALAEKVISVTGPEYFTAEGKAMDTAKNNLHLVQELLEYVKKQP